jgi:hypothetical protein
MTSKYHGGKCRRNFGKNVKTSKNVEKTAGKCQIKRPEKCQNIKKPLENVKMSKNAGKMSKYFKKPLENVTMLKNAGKISKCRKTQEKISKCRKTAEKMSKNSGKMSKCENCLWASSADRSLKVL